MEYGARMRGAPWSACVDGEANEEASGACMECIVRCHEKHKLWSQDCFDACPRCTTACNLNYNNRPFFFKYVTVCMESIYFKPAMEIPSEFADVHISDVICHVELEDANRKLWIIKVKHQQKLCILLQGWKEFAAYHSLARGDALLFQLMQTSTGSSRQCHFVVKIFKQRPLFRVNPQANPSPQCHPQSDGGHQNNDSNVECSNLHQSKCDKNEEEDAVVSKHVTCIGLQKARHVVNGGQKQKPGKKDEEEGPLNMNQLEHRKKGDKGISLQNNVRHAKKKEEDLVVSKMESRPETAAKPEANALMPSREDAKQTVNTLKPCTETSTKCNTDTNMPTNLDSIKLQKQQAKSHAEEDEPIVDSPSKRQKSNASLQDEATGTHGLSFVNTNLKRKAALKAGVSITSLYASKTPNSNITKPASLPSLIRSKSIERGAVVQAKQTTGEQCKDACKKELLSLRPDHGLEDNPNPQQQEAHSSKQLPLSFSKRLCASNVDWPFLLVS